MNILIIIAMIVCCPQLLQARENAPMQVELKYIDLPTFKTGESGPLYGRVVFKLLSADLAPVQAQASFQLEDHAEEFKGAWQKTYPGIFTSLSFPVRLDDPPQEKRVLNGQVKLRIGESITFSRLAFIYVRGSGMFFRTYRSDLDDSVYPYALYIPEGSPPTGSGWPLVVSLHGAYSNYANNMKRLFGIGNRDDEPDELAFYSLPVWPELASAGGMVVCPWGRGTMGYHGPGARDVLDVIGLVRENYPVDPERISITGLSMGGNGTWEMALRHGDLFAAAVPVCPPADMEISGFVREVLLGEKEKFPYITKILAQNRIANWAANARAFPVYIHHGNDDPTVPISHSEKMVAALRAAGIDAPLTRYDNVGHNAWDPAYKDRRTLTRLLEARREKPELEFFFTTCRYEDARYAWVEIEKFERYGDYATVEARFEPDPPRISLKTVNVGVISLALSGLPGIKPGDRVEITDADKRGMITVEAPKAGPVRLAVKDSGLGLLTPQPDRKGTPVKRKGLEGPIYQAVSDRVILVYGTGARDNSDLVQALRFADWGELPDVHFLIKPDSEVTDADIMNSHLVLFGDERTNELIGRVNMMSPVHFDGDRVVAAGERYPKGEVSFKCVFPNPLNPERLVLINFAEEWDYSNTWSFQAIFKNLPDYFIYRRGGKKPFDTEVLKAGFFDEKWSW